ncbi:ammonium transporter [Clostridium celatum]|uniref:Ammonium transporter n=1 Tax=Clostridium celatum DSM 1785 TaxID=545697 RepID=L1Q9I1_9CLOT|nr:ammonium transporter [Clostridium celatum]EKY24613.1 ammonium transporter [Clostridium celatum DSM 1785]MCE9656327.1 ammonium transporter [Clostridium celatum]MDU6297250.1 ammonium transporter [Clostridium celatum]
MIIHGDVAFMVLSTTLVLIMTPGLAFFYGGLVERKNALTIMFQVFIAIGIVSLLWIFGGFSLVFGDDIIGIIGNPLQFFAFKDITYTIDLKYSETIPFILFFMYQMMFAIITAPLMTGAFANRLTIGGWIKILIIWMILIYFPVAHWVWGGGFLSKLGFVDFAGGAVIHITSGFGCLGGIYVLGERKVKNEKGPFNLGLLALGGGLLLFGWFGFNAGGTLAAANVAAIVFANTGIAAAAGMIVWLILYSMHNNKRASFLEMIVGAVAGLATITPASGYVTPLSAVIIGALGGLVCFFCVEYERKKWDDALDVWGVHGMGGLLGTLLIGVFANPKVNNISAGINQFLIQALGALIIGVYSIVVTFLIFKVVDKIKPIRVSEEIQRKGLDQEFFQESYETKQE